MVAFLPKNYETFLIQRRHAPAPFSPCYLLAALDVRSTSKLPQPIRFHKLTLQHSPNRKYSWLKERCSKNICSATAMNSLGTDYANCKAFNKYCLLFPLQLYPSPPPCASGTLNNSVTGISNPTTYSVLTAHTGCFTWKAHFLILIWSTEPIPSLAHKDLSQYNIPRQP